MPDKKEVLFSESEFNVGQVIDNNYAKTKYEAETLMRAARDEGYNINIFRMGNISCELKGGKFQKKYRTECILHFNEKLFTLRNSSVI